MPAPDTVLQGRYRIVRQLGRGGMGAVYEAVDERLSRTVALKEMLVELEDLKRAFDREARLLANLRHPVLPKVIDHFTEDEGQFLVMEFIPGSDLGELLARRTHPFSPAEVSRWADDLLDALDYLHTFEPPVIHRDIKPSNLKLTAQGKIVLLDFGLAKGVAGQMTRTTSGMSVVGYTLNYAALEQIQGERTSPRSDLYSLAATLYQLLTGRIPEDALKRAADSFDDKEDPLVPVSKLNREVPEEFSNVLMKALSLKPSLRPGSAAEMRAALNGKAPVFAHVGMVEDDELTRVTTGRAGKLPLIGVGGDPTMVLERPGLEAQPLSPNGGAGGALDRAQGSAADSSKAKKWWLIGGSIAVALILIASVVTLWLRSGNKTITPPTAPTAYDGVPLPFRDALPSIASVTMLDASGKVTRQASGFFFKSDELATSLSVIEGAARGRVTFVGQTGAYDIADVTGVDRERGLATLRVARAKAPALAIGNKKETTLNDKVAIVGSGSKTEAAYAPGTISGYKDDHLEVAAQAAQTITGGALLNEQGEVIGIIIDSAGGGRTIAVPVNYLTDLVRRKQPAMSLSLAGAKDVLYDWRKSEPVPRPQISKELEQKIITEVARVHRAKATPTPSPQASPEATPPPEGERNQNDGTLWEKLEGEMSSATISAVAEGSFTAAGAKQTAYIIDTHSGSGADNDGPKYLAIFAGETYVADFPIPNLSLILKTQDLNRDGINELLLGYYYMQMGQAMEWAKLVHVQQGQLRVIKDFGTTYASFCDAGLAAENNPGATASVVFIAPAQTGQMPEMRVDSYKAPCAPEGASQQWKYTPEARLPEKSNK